MKRLISTILLGLFALVFVQAQPINRQTYGTTVKKAEEKKAEKDYYNALEQYQTAYEEKTDQDMAVQMALLNYELRDYRRAQRQFRSALRRDKKGKYEQYRFLYAKCMKMNEEYEDAIIELKKVIKNTTDPVIKELAESELSGAEFAQIAQEVTGVTITNAGRNVNSSNSEYSAFLAPGGKEMYFTSWQTNDLIVVDDENTDIYTKIWRSNRSDDGWEKPTALEGNINRPGFHTSNITISPDGNRMYFARQQLEGNVLSESKIFMAEKNGSDWGAAKEVNGINGNFIVTHPAVGELYGKEVLFFSSNQDGGEGQFDLFYATYKGDGVYGEPVNLGPKLNTVGNEKTPYYRDGILYFSSDGHPGLGGLDIFSTVWDGSRWSKPTNMGKGYNTSLDEYYFMLDQEGYSGFLISNRPGTRSLKSKTCCYDVFNVSLKVITADLLAKVYDKETKEPLLGATVKLIDLSDNLEKQVDQKTSQGGNVFPFGLELDKIYKIEISREDYFPDTLEFHTIGLLDSKTYDENILLQPKEVFMTIYKEKPIQLDNIYYDFNDDKILSEAEPDLQFLLDLMKDYPEMVIELSSHTDARGDNDYNENLSQRRAESAKKWLTERGIVEERIVPKGYGEAQPKTISFKLADRHDFLKEGDVLTEEFIDELETEEVQETAHRINRRTEFTILEGPTSIKLEESKLVRKGVNEIDKPIEKKN
jgi:peptidoglycan-associated lipoprotein